VREGGLEVGGLFLQDWDGCGGGGVKVDGYVCGLVWYSLVWLGSCSVGGM
jgi:hypothetical protein